MNQGMELLFPSLGEVYTVFVSLFLCGNVLLLMPFDTNMTPSST